MFRSRSEDELNLTECEEGVAVSALLNKSDSLTNGALSNPARVKRSPTSGSCHPPPFARLSSLNSQGLARQLPEAGKPRWMVSA